MELTSKKYWQDYYQASSEDRQLITTICGAYDFYWDMMVKSCHQPPQSVLEIGAFPGRYLGYVASRYKLKATGLDFNPDAEKVKRSMVAMGVPDFNYICSDFLLHTPTQKFDVVFSNGFIEHFSNYDEVLDKHVAYLNDGGSLLVMIPNKRYLRKVYGYLLDYENLKAHNLKCMNLKMFKTFAERNQLTTRYLSYHGGFAYKVHQPLSLWQKVLYKPIRFVSRKLQTILSAHPSKWYSGTIIAVFTKE